MYAVNIIASTIVIFMLYVDMFGKWLPNVVITCVQYLSILIQ